MSFPSIYTNLQYNFITLDDYEYHAFKMLQMKSQTFFFFLITLSEMKNIYIYIYISQKKYIYHTHQRIVRHDLNLELSVKSFIVHPPSLCIKLL